MDRITTIDEAWQFAGELMTTRTDVLKQIFSVEYPEMVFEKFSAQEALQVLKDFWKNGGRINF